MLPVEQLHLVAVNALAHKILRGVLGAQGISEVEIQMGWGLTARRRASVPSGGLGIGSSGNVLGFGKASFPQALCPVVEWHL